MRKKTALTATTLLALTAGLGVGAATASGGALNAGASKPDTASAALHSSSGTHIGWVKFADRDGGVDVSVDARWVKPGFHGLHIHAIGECDKRSAAPDTTEPLGAFLSAGGHWKKDQDANHPDHTGDLPTVYAGENTKVRSSFWTDRFTVADMFDEDGSAVMLHQGVDNYANVPERYTDELDKDTLNTGDAGSRAACGVVKR